MENSLVSIIVPIYNSEKYLQNCINSILNQTYTNIELILVNDGSKDNSENICKFFCEIDNRVKYYVKENGGAASARNLGLMHVSGEIISFVDSDDYIEKNMIEIMTSKMIQYKADIVVCGRYKDYTDKIKKIHCFEGDRFINHDKALCDMMCNDEMDFSLCDKIFKKNVWRDVFIPEGTIGEDILVMPRLFKKAQNIVHIGTPLYHYRYTENSVTVDKLNPHTFDTLKAIECLEKEFENPSKFEKKSLLCFKTIQYNFYLQKLYNAPENNINNNKALDFRRFLFKNIIDILLNERIAINTKMMTCLLLSRKIYKLLYR